MRIKTSQLREGYILLSDVRGNSGHTLIRKNTILTSEHIQMLQNAFIPEVEITEQSIELLDKVNPKQQVVAIVERTPEKTLSFDEHFLQVVASYKQEFQQWDSGEPINIANVREMIMPLLLRAEQLDIEVYTLNNFVEAEEYIYHHAVSVSLISTFIAKELGFSHEDALQVGLAGILCDAGMTKIDEDILTKDEPLTERQQQDIRKHPIYSSEMIENLSGLSSSVKLAVLQHHERMNGTGYPAGKSGEEIHLFARILAVSDTYNAMSSARIYKNRQTIHQIFATIESQQYTAFDPRIVQAFIKSLTLRSLGKKVKLSNGRTGVIVFINENNATRPLIKMDDTREIISLMEKIDLEILKFIK